jgi:hypothetical protein
MRWTLSGYLVVAVAFCLPTGCQKAAIHQTAKKVDFAEASRAHDDAEMDDIDGGEDLVKWAKQDWPRVESLLTKMAIGKDPRTATRAQTLLYKRLLQTGDTKALSAARDRLKETAEDQKALGYCRATAIEALLSSNWNGRDIGPTE